MPVQFGLSAFWAMYSAVLLAVGQRFQARGMRRGPARGRCRGKTGTISGVSAVSGYCTARSGADYAFSILMNGVNTTGARKLQDGMLHVVIPSRQDDEQAVGYRSGLIRKLLEHERVVINLNASVA